MQFPESWLRSFVDPKLTTDELAHALTMAGLEVEDQRPVLIDVRWRLGGPPGLESYRDEFS